MRDFHHDVADAPHAPPHDTVSKIDDASTIMTPKLPERARRALP
jgi:hypothetical protein